MENRQKNQEEQNLVPLKMALYSGSALAFIAGFACWLSPESVENFIGLDAETTKYLSIALIAVGFGDIIAAHFLLKKK
ncbi:MAG: hypothetical protein R3E13_01185 [Alphaproteobacteria bacterium]